MGLRLKQVKPDAPQRAVGHSGFSSAAADTPLDPAECCLPGPSSDQPLSALMTRNTAGAAGLHTRFWQRFL